jgi:hypothetical protein
MDTDTLIWIVVAVVVALVVIGLLVALMNKRKQRQQAARAAELRQDAVTRTPAVDEADVRAKEAQVEADRARYEAQQAEARAQEAQQARLVEEAEVEDRLREADHLDPHVDTAADDYQPQPPSGGTHRAP